MRRLGLPLPAPLRAAGTVAVVVTVLAGVLGGCGEQQAPGSADAPAAASDTTGPAPAGPSAPAEDGAVAVERVELVSESVAGGAVSWVATPLVDDAAVATFTAQFEGEALPAAVGEAVAGLEVAEGASLYGAVVAVGCEVPDDVLVTTEGSELLVTPVKGGGPEEQCFAPVTTVALVVVRR